MKPKSATYIPKRDNEHPRHFMWECPQEPFVTHHNPLKSHLLIRKIYCASGVHHSVKASIHGIFLDMLIAIRGCSWMLTRIKTGTGLRFSNVPSTLQTRSHVLKSKTKAKRKVAQKTENGPLERSGRNTGKRILCLLVGSRKQ